jgi:hypothetical protein
MSPNGRRDERDPCARPRTIHVFVVQVHDVAHVWPPSEQRIDSLLQGLCGAASIWQRANVRGGSQLNQVENGSCECSVVSQRA